MTARADRILPAVLLVLMPGPGIAATLSVNELMGMLSGTESSTASFVETKHSALLKTPLLLRGTLAYRRPDWLEKHVIHPYDERIILDRGRLTIDNRSRNRKTTLSVAAAPVLAALVESIRATRAGDLPALESHYEVKVDGHRGKWSINLKPLDTQVAEHVSAVTVSGAAARIVRIEVQETSGDRAVMDISEEIK